MKAAIIRVFGDPSVLAIAEVDTPRPRPGHVLVKILAAGVNRFDHYIREGSVVPELPSPHILGADAAGEIAEIGQGVDALRVGDRVVPMTGYPDDPGDADIHPNSAAPSFGVSGLSRPGSYAQYQEVPARWVVKDETGLPPEQVAALPMAASPPFGPSRWSAKRNQATTSSSLPARPGPGRSPCKSPRR